MARLVARLKACPDEELEFSHTLLQLLWKCNALALIQVRNPFAIRSYQKYVRKPFRMRTYKIIGLKVS